MLRSHQMHKAKWKCLLATNEDYYYYSQQKLQVLFLNCEVFAFRLIRKLVYMCNQLPLANEIEQ